MFIKEAKIYLTGFMTSGKSTIGPILANVLGLNFYDLDKEIERIENRTIVEIFQQKGEKYFRDLESRILSKLAMEKGVVISLGGGTIISPHNFVLMKKTGTIVYLRVSTETLYKRLKNKIDRPLFRDLVLSEKNEKEFLRRIEEVLNNRKKFYEQADIIIDSEDRPIGITVDELAKAIKESYNEKNQRTSTR
ncbi:shikimate kinase [Melioribacteraceae bacterium 4301-Me]|uniref:shikimate kinase n=1 Tax=Pyranulibacter aquaticus TaxID=3163344 RepID=UPI00359B34E9